MKRLGLVIFSLITCAVSSIIAQTDLESETLLAKASQPQATHHIAEQNLISYLKGSWDVTGEWNTAEGEKHITIQGKDNYEPLLRHQFLQKNFEGAIHVEDAQEPSQVAFSSLTMFYFDQKKHKYSFWYFDSQGDVMQADGGFQQADMNYTFSTLSYNKSGESIKSIYSLQPISKHQFNWTVMGQDSNGAWKEVAKGTNTRVT